MPQFSIDPAIFQRYPGTQIGVITAHGIRNHGSQPEVLAQLAAEVARLPERITGELTEHPHIAAWRAAYQAFGVKPKKYPSSIENLVRRVLNGHALGHINSLVDAYNAISLRYLLPVGGEDLDQTRGDIVLTFAGAAEPPVQLLGEADARPPYAGEVIYRDDVSAICRRWNWKEADRTKLTEVTERAILVIETLPPIPGETLRAALGELDALVRTWCHAETMTAVLDAHYPAVDLPVP